MSSTERQLITTLQSPYRPSSFWKYWAASATSNFGSGISTVAFPIIAIVFLHATNFQVGLITAANYAAVVLIGLPAGVIVQRFALRETQVVLDLLRAVAVLTIPVAIWLHAITLMQLLLVAFIVGLASNLFDVANATFVPLIITKQQLIARNNLLQGTYATTQLVGPAIGGLLVQTVGGAVGVVIDSFTYLASATLLRTIPVTESPERPGGTGPGFVRRIADGLQWVWHHPMVRATTIAATVLNFVCGALTAATPTFIVRTLHLPVGVVGLVIAAQSVGSIIAATWATPFIRWVGTSRALILATLGGAILCVCMPLARAEWAPVVFSVGSAGFGATETIFSIVARSHRQAVSPPELLSRVMASVRFISWGALPVGALVGGAVAGLWSPRAALVLVFVSAFGAPTALWFSRVRTVRELE